jgi:thiamine transporter ThiT
MKKKTAFRLMVTVVVVSAIAMILSFAGTIPEWLYLAVLVAGFPVFVLSLGLWWMAREGDADIPFMGY